MAPRHDPARIPRLARLTALVAIMMGAAAACTDEKIVYRDAPRFEPPPSEAVGFLGYQDVDSRQTICGDCHVAHQGKWIESKHATAWVDLQGSGHGQPVCENCHTTGQLGNASPDANGGYAGTQSERYHDVQCESCHGPGLTHAENPEASGKPMASVNLDPTLASTNGCAACHNGSRHPFAEEWAEGAHGAMEFTMEDPSYIVTNSSCQGCHTGEGALARAGVTTTFSETGHVPSATDFLRITCAVCHDPHGSDIEGQLRFAIDTPDPTQNLCVRCHNRRAVPDPTSTRGPHSSSGMLNLGSNVGWRPPGMTTDRIVNTHGDEQSNAKLCVTCHMPKATIDNPDGSILMNSTGHLFFATPCKDAEGKPTAEQGCAITERSFDGCTASGCHGSPVVARSLLAASEIRINSKLTELKALLEGANVPCTEFAATAAGTQINPARGARFNYLLATGHAPQLTDPAGCTNRALSAPVADHGQLVHNPPLLESLLQASIDAVKAKYYVP